MSEQAKDARVRASARRREVPITAEQAAAIQRDDERRVIIATLLGKRTWESADLRREISVQEIARLLVP